MLPDLYLAEVHIDVFSGLLVKLCASNLLSKVSNANSIAGVELLDEKITAGLDHAVYLVHDGAVHHMDNTLLPYRDAGRVGKLYESLHHLCGCERRRRGGEGSRDKKKRVKMKMKEREGTREEGKWSKQTHVRMFLSIRAK